MYIRYFFILSQPFLFYLIAIFLWTIFVEKCVKTKEVTKKYRFLLSFYFSVILLSFGQEIITVYQSILGILSSLVYLVFLVFYQKISHNKILFSIIINCILFIFLSFFVHVSFLFMNFKDAYYFILIFHMIMFFIFVVIKKISFHDSIVFLSFIMAISPINIDFKFIIAIVLVFLELVIFIRHRQGILKRESEIKFNLKNIRKEIVCSWIVFVFSVLMVPFFHHFFSTKRDVFENLAEEAMDLKEYSVARFLVRPLYQPYVSTKSLMIWNISIRHLQICGEIKDIVEYSSHFDQVFQSSLKENSLYEAQLKCE